jgi:hypothetical protein
MLCLDGMGGMMSTGYSPWSAWCRLRKAEYRLRVVYVWNQYSLAGVLTPRRIT